MPIIPDQKNWTWVLEKPCPECGLDVSSIDPRKVADMLRDNAAAWPAVLASPAATQRPDDATWSPVEYGAHVRDVFQLFATRLNLMLTQDDARFDNWDQNATAIEKRYAEQDPGIVAREIAESGNALADAFDAVTDEQWTRTGRRSDGATFTVDSFARYLIHDPVHHLHDVTRTA
ncbi:MAG: DinB family protein [Actinomycetota bacterium]